MGRFEIEKDDRREMNLHNESMRRRNETIKDQHSLFKDFKTVDHHFEEGSKLYSGNKRSMEIIVLAIIAGFFVALGSNISRMLQ